MMDDGIVLIPSVHSVMIPYYDYLLLRLFFVKRANVWLSSVFSGQTAAAPSAEVARTSDVRVSPLDDSSPVSIRECISKYIHVVPGLEYTVYSIRRIRSGTKKLDHEVPEQGRR
jgi:hypothetical protein